MTGVVGHACGRAAAPESSSAAEEPSSPDRHGIRSRRLFQGRLAEEILDGAMETRTAFTALRRGLDEAPDPAVLATRQ